jgi:hypothetical protein
MTEIAFLTEKVHDLELKFSKVQRQVVRLRVALLVWILAWGPGAVLVSLVLAHQFWHLRP